MSEGPITNPHQDFLLQKVQPAMVGLIDGSLSTLAPIFAVAVASHKPFYAFVGGLATSIGAGLSDTGELTGRGNPLTRGGITGIGTFIGGILHTLPFLIPNYHVALLTALIVVLLELVMLAALRARYFSTSFATSLGAVTVAGIVIVAVSTGIGAAA